MALRLVAPPVAEPLSLALCKQWAKIETDAEDDLLEQIVIPACRGMAEAYTERSLMEQTWQLTLDAFPASAIELRRPPIKSIVSVKYIDSNGVEQTLDSSLYSLDKESEPGWLMPAAGTEWPDTMDTANAVKIQFKAGYETVPAAFLQFIALHVGNFYANRESVNVGNIANEMPFVTDLIQPYKIY